MPPLVSIHRLARGDVAFAGESQVTESLNASAAILHNVLFAD